MKGEITGEQVKAQVERRGNDVAKLRYLERFFNNLGTLPSKKGRQLSGDGWDYVQNQRYELRNKLEEYRELGEIPATKRYVKTLKQIYREKGLLNAIDYEIKSSLYSLWSRIAGLLDLQPEKYRAPSKSEIKAGVSIPEGGRFVTYDYMDWEMRQKERKVRQSGHLLRGERESLLEKTAGGTAAIIGLIGAIFFFSANMTGNVIGINNSTSNYIGALFLVMGIVGAFFWMRNKKK